MTVLDAELPYSLIDLVLSISAGVMAAILMCLSAGYFATTMPCVILSIWGEFHQHSQILSHQPVNRKYSTTKILPPHLPSNPPFGSRSQIPSLQPFH